MDPISQREGLRSQLRIEPGNMVSSLQGFIRGYMEELERDGVILGLSGGVDSAVVSVLCKRAVGAQKVLALIMPEKESQVESSKDALNLAQDLGIKTRLIDITPYLRKFGTYKLFPIDKLPLPSKLKGKMVRKAYHFYEGITGESPFSAGIQGLRGKKLGPSLQRANAYYRIKHRLRMVLLYLWGERENRLVVGGANKTEYMIGFFVKHGCDDAADIMPLLSLYKTQVLQLARYMKIPSSILNKLPSPDLVPGIIDEETIGVPYERLDMILLALERGWEIPRIGQVLGTEESKIEYVRDLVRRSEHMRQVYHPNYSNPHLDRNI